MNDLALRSLDYISLCAGGGGLDLGLGLAVPAARPVVYVEREAYAVARLVEAMHSELLARGPVWSDATTFRGRPWRGLVDGLAGGIPCQPHSNAGKRLRADDDRDLWTTTRRIIAQARPWWVFIENVDGMLHPDGAGRLRRDLPRLGYQVEAGLFSAAEVGLPHERVRFFCLAVADPDGGLLDGWAGEPGWGPAGRTAADWAGTRPVFPPGFDDTPAWGALLREWPEYIPCVRGRPDGLATRLDELRMLGNGVVPVVGALAFRTLAARLAARGSAGADLLVRMMG